MTIWLQISGSFVTAGAFAALRLRKRKARAKPRGVKRESTARRTPHSIRET
jgi:hypothetical protein